MSKERAKGTSWESAVVSYLREGGFPFAKRTGSVDADLGDIDLSDNVVIECKSVARIDLAAIVDQMEAARKRKDAHIGAAWIKRRGKTSPADGYVVMTGEQFYWILYSLIEVDEDGRP